jgi:uncharacterized membrane protein
MIPHPTRAYKPTLAAEVALGLMAAAWAAFFGWQSVLRHLSLGSHAEDLGFTDQVIANFLRGQWFRMSIYAGDWNTELDISHILRPDSLLAFHVEPMLLLFVPLYALGAGVVWLLLLQAAAVAAGAIPAYRLGGLALALVYLLSPLGQWAVLSDFHTSTVATPLLILAVERIAHGSPRVGLAAALLALTAREDVGPVLVGLGILVGLGLKRPRLGTTLAASGVAWTAVCLLVIRAYSGGSISPFASRYAATLGGGPVAIVAALGRPLDIGYVGTLLLSGGWLALLAPLGLVPALPSLALNLLSSSAWMASGRAHYSALVLPFVIVAAGAALTRPAFGSYTRLLRGGLVAGSVVGYVLAGAGPLAADAAPPTLTEHARLAETLASGIPEQAAVSASSALVPHLSRRARVYVFPAVLDADDVFLDLSGSPAPTSAGDVFLRVRDLVAGGGWEVAAARDGLLLLERSSAAPPLRVEDLPPGLMWFVQRPAATMPNEQSPTLVGASLEPSPDAAMEPDGPRWILRTQWSVARPLAPGARLEFAMRLSDGDEVSRSDLAPLWWYPPERWSAGEVISVDVPGVPVQRFRSWRPIVSTP